MDTLSTSINNTSNIVDLLTYARDCSIIDEQRYADLQSELSIFTKELVLIYNARNSSSVHKDEFLCILDTLNYIFMHGYNHTQQVDYLQTKGIKDFFYEGVEVLKSDIKQIELIYTLIQQDQLPYPNERYQSIINEQIPNYLEEVNSARQWFHYSSISYDLDYPLIDGIPLFQHMYNKQGSDLVLTYIQYFYTENLFINHYKEDLEQLLHEFQQVKGIDYKLLDINLFELVIHQCIAAIILGKKDTILLNAQDIKRLNHINASSKNIKQVIEEAFHILINAHTGEIKKHLEKHSHLIIHNFLTYIEGQVDFLIYPISENKQIFTLQSESSSNYDYLSIYYKFEQCNSLNEQICLMQQSQLGIYDLFDLLDSSLFTFDDYYFIYASFEPIVLAALIKIQNPEINSFHQKVQLQQNIKRFNTYSDWDYQLYQFIQTLSDSLILQIENLINNMNIL